MPWTIGDSVVSTELIDFSYAADSELGVATRASRSAVGDWIAERVHTLLPDGAARRAARRGLADHLGPGGLAEVDIWMPDAEDLARYDGRIILEWPRLDPK